MADVSKTIAILFEAVDNTGTAFALVGKSIKDLGDNVETATQPLADLTKWFLAGEAAAVGLGAAFLRVALTESQAFGRELVSLNKVMGDGEGAARDYVPVINELSEKFGVSARDVVTLSSNLMEAGYTANQVFGSEANGFGLAGKTLEAVKVSTFNADEASTKLIQTLLGFGQPIEQAGDVLDTLNFISANNALTFADLTEAVSRVGPAAAQAGLSIEQTAEILTPLVSKFQSGEIAGTAFNSIMLQLGSGADRVTSALDAIGVAQTGVNGAMLPAAQILQNLADKWPELTREQQLYYAGQIAGIEQAPKLLAILQDFPETLDQQTLANRNAGSSAQELAAIMDDASARADSTRVRWENLRRAIGDEFSQGADQANTAMGTLASVLRELVENDKLEPFFSALRPLFSGFAEDIEGIAQALPAAFENVDWSEFTAAVERLKAQFGGLFDGLDITTPEGLTRVLQSLIDTLEGAANITSGIATGLDPLLKIIGGLVTGFNSLDPEIQRTIGLVLGFATTFNIVGGATKTFGEALESVGKIVSSAAALFGANGLAGALSSVAGSASALGPALAGAGVALLGFKIGEKISEVTGFQRATDEWLLSLKGIPPLVTASDDVVRRSGDTYARLSEIYGITLKSNEDLQDAVRDGRLVFDETSGDFVNVAARAEEMQRRFDATKVSAEDVRAAFNLLGAVTGMLVDEQGRVVQSSTALDETNKELIESELRRQQLIRDGADGLRELGGWFAETALDANDFHGSTQLANEAIDALGGGAAVLAQALDDFGLAWQTPADGARDLADALQSQGFSGAAQTLREIGTSITDVSYNDAAYQMQRVAEALYAVGQTDAAMQVEDLARQYQLLGYAAPGVVQSQEDMVAAANALRPSVDGLGEGMNEIVTASGRYVEVSAGVYKQVTNNTEAAKKETDAVKEKAAEQAILNRATTEYLLGWEKIKSDERVAVYEIRSNVEIARIEADAERVVAAYDSIARSFENTGEVLSNLFDIWSGADRIGDRDQIEDWIKREYEIREKMADAQVGLIDAEIRRINAQTAMLARGGMDVRITSDGLEPALESFMFQVIDKVRLSVAGSYEEFLIGCGSSA